MIYTFLSIGMGAACGAWIRWWFSSIMNGIFPTIPLGTLASNLLGGFLIGLFMALTKNHAFISETARLTITVGFLGGLTTFSTFSAESVTLLSEQEYFFFALIIIAHVVGSLLATIFGIYTVKFFIS